MAIPFSQSIFGSSAPLMIFNYGIPDVTFSANASTNNLSSPLHGLVNGQRIKVSSTGTLPSPLSTNGIYYVINKTVGTFQVSTTKNGTAIDITNTGSGTHSFNTEISIILDHVAPEEFGFEDGEEIIQKSRLEADRTIINRGEFINWQMQLYLFKYDSLELARSKFEEIYQYNKSSKIYLKEHRDGELFKDSDGNPVPFHLKITRRNLTTLDYRDVLILKFRSLRDVDFSNGTTLLTQPNEIIMGGGFQV